MQLPPFESPTPDAPDFAGLLSALTAPGRKKREPSWNDEDLSEDVATLSYESALRAHARRRPDDNFDSAFTQLHRPCFAENQRPSPAQKTQAATGKCETAPWRSLAVDKERKSASITVRMSQAECDQLRGRAAEAGLTLSAYLRSCTLEAETLRAQVKEALAEMKKAGTEGTREQGNEKTEKQGNDEAPDPRSSGPVRDRENEAGLQRIAARSRLGRVLLPIRGLGTRLFHRRSL